MNEKKIQEKQLLLLEKKEKKSTWLRNKTAKNRNLRKRERKEEILESCRRVAQVVLAPR